MDINRFEKTLQNNLHPVRWDGPRSIVEDVIKASLKATGNEKKVDTDMLINAALRDPELMADIHAVAGRLLNDKLI